MIFSSPQSFSPGKRLYWAVGVMALGALVLSTLPENKILARAAAVSGLVGMNIARYKIAQGRREK